MASEYSHPLLATLHPCVYPLVIVLPTLEVRLLGSSFIIAHQGPKHALLMTAAHVLREANRLDVPPRQQHPSGIAELIGRPVPSINRKVPKLYLGIPYKGGYQLADVIDSWFSEEVDIGMIVARIREETNAAFLGRLALDMSPPKIGTRLIAFGYPKMTVEYGEQNPETGALTITGGTLFEFRSGAVTELCKPGTTTYKGPGFIMECPFHSGMSGGPVVEMRDGEEAILVRGLITGDLTDQGNGAFGSGKRAFVSMLAPALVLKTRIGIVGRGDDAVQVIDLVRQGFIDERGGALEHVRIIELPDGRFTLRWAADWA